MLGNLIPSIQQKVLNPIKKRQAYSIRYNELWMDNFIDDLMLALKNIDVLTINDEEARQLSGEYSLVKAAENIIIWT